MWWTTWAVDAVLGVSWFPWDHLSLGACCLSPYGMLLRYTMASPLSSRLAGVCLHVLSRRIMHVSHCVPSHRVRLGSSSQDGEQGAT